MYVYSIEMCILLYIQYIHTLQVRMSTSGIVMHYIGWGCLSCNPRKYAVLNGCLMFDLHDFNLCDIAQEHKPGVKRVLTVFYSKMCVSY